MTGRIILAGNPNVGKSTLFNALTGLRQHTGNWSGKTVGCAVGKANIGGREKMIIDTPGTYSLTAASPDEENARNSICGEDCDCIVVVCDGCCLQRSLYLALQIMERRSNVIICVNLMDEAGKRGISLDLPRLSERLGVPVVGISAAKNRDLSPLLGAITAMESQGASKMLCTVPSDTLRLKKLSSELCRDIVSEKGHKKLSRLDRLLCHKILALPIMLLLLLIILWLSISAANLPSELLSRFFAWLGGFLKSALIRVHTPEILVSVLIDGVYNTLTWVVAVMLPPMAIFFPLFTLLEDWGLLPRIAFNMDWAFGKCGGCGKQALTMCMGLGCNAVGVTGCRIIAGRKEKLIAIVTNSLMPCNGRFPTIILLSSILAPAGAEFASAVAVLAIIVFGVMLTLLSSKLLSVFLAKEESSPFTLELPPFRLPKIGQTLLRSLFDRTALVLGRAVKAAAPAGLLIWLLGNMQSDGRSLFDLLRGLLDGPGMLLGLDGAILLGFILGFPANEIVLPIIVMCYLSGGSLSALPPPGELGIFLAENGWTQLTFIAVMVFTLLHWPCATTLMTIKKECGKLRYALLAAALPTVWGILFCLVLRIFA